MTKIHTSILAVATLLTAPVTNADDGYRHDPHYPNYVMGYCPGGGFGYTGQNGYCDGAQFDDGSFWHIVGVFIPLVGWKIDTSCRVHNGTAVPASAPIGGCNGEVR